MSQSFPVAYNPKEAAKMNLALIDPFQLAQDSPDALVDEFSKCCLIAPYIASNKSASTQAMLTGTQDPAMPLHSDSVGKATTWLRGESMAKSSSGKHEHPQRVRHPSATRRHRGSGDLLRSTTDGVRDMETMGVAMKLRGHWKQIQSLRYIHVNLCPLRLLFLAIT